MSAANTNGSRLGASDWGEEVMPGVFLSRKAGSAAEAALRSGLGTLLANAIANDGSTIDYSKVYARIKERKDLAKKLRESNEYMVKYLTKEKKRRAKRLQELGMGGGKEENEASKMNEHGTSAAAVKSANDCSDGEDEADLPPITPEEDDRVIEESILENELIIKDCEKEIEILNQLVVMHKCMKSGNANEALSAGDGSAAALDGYNSNASTSDDDDDAGEESPEEGEEDDNAPFEDDVTGMHDAMANGGGRFAL